MKPKARVIAFYLPQYHPTPENDKFWGKGFTEWTNTAKAKPLFRGHYQPHVPADLGFYDLRMPETRQAQADLAREAGVEGFCYWHYWFGNGKQFLQDIFDEVVATKKPDFPFCVGWANHSWNNKNWVTSKSSVKDSIIAEQTYPGEEDNINHFYSLLDAFKDERYIKVDGKLLFLVYAPQDLKDSNRFIELWNELAHKEGLAGFHFVGVSACGELFSVERRNIPGHDKPFIEASTLFNEVEQCGFDAINSRGMTLAHYKYYSKPVSLMKMMFAKFTKSVFNWQPIQKYDYRKLYNKIFCEEDTKENVYPTLIPNWDRSPRSGRSAVIWYNYSPEYFKKQILHALDLIKDKQDEHKILFLMSWNEWAEGNYMEPDLENGHGFLDALKESIVD